MDIRTKAVNLTGRLHLRDADDELMFNKDGKECAVNLFGPGSKQFAKAQAAQANRLMNRMKSKGKIEQTAEQKAAENAEFLADCTDSWENVEYGDLEGRAKSHAIYSDQEIGFIADQVAKFIGDWSNFTKKSVTI